MSALERACLREEALLKDVARYEALLRKLEGEKEEAERRAREAEREVRGVKEELTASIAREVSVGMELEGVKAELDEVRVQLQVKCAEDGEYERVKELEEERMEDLLSSDGDGGDGGEGGEGGEGGDADGQSGEGGESEGEADVDAMEVLLEELEAVKADRDRFKLEVQRMVRVLYNQQGLVGARTRAAGGGVGGGVGVGVGGGRMEMRLMALREELDAVQDSFR